MTTCVRRAPSWLRITLNPGRLTAGSAALRPLAAGASAATTAVLAAVGLCLLLVGLTRTPGVEVGDTFQFLPRAAHAHSVPSVAVAEQQSAAGEPITTVDGDPPGDLLAAPPSPAYAGPHLIRLTVAGPTHVTCLPRTVGAAGCRGPPA